MQIGWGIFVQAWCGRIVPIQGPPGRLASCSLDEWPRWESSAPGGVPMALPSRDATDRLSQSEQLRAQDTAPRKYEQC